MTAMEGSLNRPDHQEQPNSGSQSQRWKLWSPKRCKYWLLLLGAGALVAVAAVILVLTLGGPGKPRDGTDDSGSSSHFAPAATAVADDFSREISLGGGALTMITSQANGTDGRFFDIEDGERVSAAAAPAEPKPGQPDSYLATTQRQNISQSTLSVEVAQVASAVDQVRAIAESFGGFVE